MNIFDTMKVSGSALTTQRQRIDVISSNMANIETTRTAEGGPYRRRQVVMKSTDLGFADRLEQSMRGAVNGVEVQGVAVSNLPPRMIFDPSHPDADQNGYVAKPNINLIEETASMLAATRAYEANVTVIKTAKRMALKALEIGR